MGWYRCKLSDLEDSYTLTIDLLLDDGIVEPSLRYFGEMRSMLNDVTPVIFLPENGIVDFGSHETDEFRYGNMHLHGLEMHEGQDFLFIWNDGENDLILYVDTLSAHGSASVIKKGGRPKKDDEWTKFWLAVTEIAKDGKLNSLYFPSQESLSKELMDEYGVGLSYDSLRPRVRQIWERLELSKG